MNNKPKVSIVVPIYNKEQILYKCLDSLVNQTMQDIEIILINDGSTDNSEAVCLDYVEKYPNLVQYHAFENGGVSKARNRGIDLATGEYIGFVDSDDWVSLDFCEKMYLLFEDKKCGLAVSDMCICISQKKLYYSLSENVTFDNFLYTNPVLRNSASNKLYKLCLIRKFNIYFPVGSHSCEDFAFVFMYLLANKPFVRFSSVNYYYYKNTESVTCKDLDSDKILYENFYVIDFICDFCSRNNLLTSFEYLFSDAVINQILIENSFKIFRYLTLIDKYESNSWKCFAEKIKKYRKNFNLNSYFIFAKSGFIFVLFKYFPYLILVSKKLKKKILG